MAYDKIMTQHPEDKAGVNIERSKYNVICDVILETIRDRCEVTFTDLMAEVEGRLTNQFDGSIPWYVTTVKLDLEARQVFERIPKSSPQRLRIM